MSVSVKGITDTRWADQVILWVRLDPGGRECDLRAPDVLSAEIDGYKI